LQAQKHYLIVRKCPQSLLTNDFALAVGMAFCTRKMCYDDRNKRNFTDMVWMHLLKSVAHFDRANPLSLRRRDAPRDRWSKTTETIARLARKVGYQWILDSLLDIWHFRHLQHQLLNNTDYGGLGLHCWWEDKQKQHQQGDGSSVHRRMRRLYLEVYARLNGLAKCSSDADIAAAANCGVYVPRSDGSDPDQQEDDDEELRIYNVLGRSLTCANPVTTWSMLRRLALPGTIKPVNTDTAKHTKATRASARSSSSANAKGCHFQLIQKILEDFSLQAEHVRHSNNNHNHNENNGNIMSSRTNIKIKTNT